LRIERLNSELNQENALKKYKGFEDFKGLSLNNNYAMYDNKGYSSPNYLGNEKNLNTYNQNQTFNNNFSSSLYTKQTSSGYRIPNASEIQNNVQAERESSKTGTFNKKSGEEEIDAMLMDKSKQNQAIDQLNVFIFLIF